MRIRITAGGIISASGEVEIGTELEVGDPTDWNGRYEIISGDAPADAVAVTNRRGRPPKDAE